MCVSTGVHIVCIVYVCTVLACTVYMFVLMYDSVRMYVCIYSVCSYVCMNVHMMYVDTCVFV